MSVDSAAECLRSIAKPVLAVSGQFSFELVSAPNCTCKFAMGVGSLGSILLSFASESRLRFIDSNMVSW